MKKIMLTGLLFLSLASGKACEICGSSHGNSYIGILPHFKNRFIGLRYQFNTYRTRLADDPSEFSRDYFQSVEVWTGFSLSKRLQLLAFLPFNRNHQVSDNGTTNISGLGDISVLLNYKLWSKNSSGNNKNPAQELWIGGGLKLPTGHFEIEPGDPDLASVANIQRGSGSSDLLLNLMYNLRAGNWGFTANTAYKINSQNRADYRFGNKFSFNSFVYRSFTSGNHFVSPNLGFLYENSRPSRLDNSKIDLTGGSLLLGSAGIEFGFPKIALGLNIQAPVHQDFAEGQTKCRVRGMAHITFAL